MRIEIKPLTEEEKRKTLRMRPLMYVLNGSLVDSPQETHKHNNEKHSQEFLEQLLNGMPVVEEPGFSGASRRWWFGIPVFHMPIVGGWRNYIVLEPISPTTVWYCGWSFKGGGGYSRIPLTGYVRTLIGDGPVKFFGLNQSGEVIPIRKIGAGQIGIRGPYSRVPLL